MHRVSLRTALIVGAVGLLHLGPVSAAATEGRRVSSTSHVVAIITSVAPSTWMPTSSSGTSLKYWM